MAIRHRGEEIIRTEGKQLVLTIDTEAARAAGRVHPDTVSVIKRLMIGAGVNAAELRRAGIKIEDLVSVPYFDLAQAGGWERLQASIEAERAP